MMTTQIEYLKAEFLKYFPDTDIEIHTEIPERIDAIVRDTPKSVPDFLFSMQIGSDDCWYRFCDDNGVILTIPLEPQELMFQGKLASHMESR